MKDIESFPLFAAFMFIGMVLSLLTKHVLSDKTPQEVDYTITIKNDYL